MKNGDQPAMPGQGRFEPHELGAHTLAGEKPRDPVWKQSPGLTKRELFAAMAMQGLCSGKYLGEPAQEATKAVQFADALLAELERGDEG
jgi:hypothetical protein